jgi:2,4-dienoyl-CoA reductase-like NADH-dependent reductase (Old Yellow Enzyme family)
MRAAEPFGLGALVLRNRLVATAHARGLVEDGLPLPADAEYWRRHGGGAGVDVPAPEPYGSLASGVPGRDGRSR